MKKFIVTKKQYQRLLETGSNSAAMDLDRYVQSVSYDTSNGNENLEDSIQEIIDNLKELSFMFKVGKKINDSTKNQIFKIVDDVKSVYDSSVEKP